MSLDGNDRVIARPSLNVGGTNKIFRGKGHDNRFTADQRAAMHIQGLSDFNIDHLRWPGKVEFKTPGYDS